MDVVFSRSSQVLDDALLATSIAEVARSKGVDPKPHFARGAKIFADGVGPEHLEPPFIDVTATMSRHIIMYEDDVDDLVQELAEKLPYSIRKIKPSESLRALPEKHSLMDVSPHATADGVESVSSASEVVVFNVPSVKDTAVVEVVVRNTFIDVFVPSADERTVNSAHF